MLFEQFCLWSAEKKLDFSLALCVCHVLVTIRDVERGWDRIFQMIILFKCIGVDLRVTITLKITKVDR